MDAPLMFLIGGPAYSGTTLLTLLLNQHDLVCLDEPDFHNPEQSHRGILLLRTLFPDRAFPDPPHAALDYDEHFRFIEQCARALEPLRRGITACNWRFVKLAQRYRRAGYPVIAIVRDIRDALVRPLPPYVTERSLNECYRLVWQEIHMYDHWLRYEDLVADPATALAPIAALLKAPLDDKRSWPPERVHPTMLKYDRHEPLRSGRISTERVGIWMDAARGSDSEPPETALFMGSPSLPRP